MRWAKGEQDGEEKIRWPCEVRDGQLIAGLVLLDDDGDHSALLCETE